MASIDKDSTASASASNVDDSDDNWERWTEDTEDEAAQSLFCPVKMTSVKATVEYDEHNYKFSIQKYIDQEQLDEYSIIRLINFIRTEVKEGRDPRPVLSAGAAGADWLHNDMYLKPVLEDDALLFYEWLTEDEGLEHGGVTDIPSTSGGLPAAASAAAEVEQLRAENEALRSLVLELRRAFMPDEMQEDITAQLDMMDIDEARVSRDAARAAAAAGPTTSADAAKSSTRRGAMSAAVDQHYFESYSGLGIHREMLEDVPRTEAYRVALKQNPGVVSGATVLDVGCGTGILSMFAARGGAAHVIGVDASARVAQLAQEVVAHNQLQGVVHVRHGKLEELDDLGVEKVDVLVSEWMGYALLFESMLDSVLYARDKWLRPGGVMMPDRVTMHVAGVSEDALGLDFWKSVYGFSMSPIAATARQSLLNTANVIAVRGDHLITPSVQIKEMDLMTMTTDQHDFTTEFSLAATSAAATPCGAIALWFDAAFSERVCPAHPCVLSTSPSTAPTHWMQTVLVLKAPILLSTIGHSCMPDLLGRSSAQGNENTVESTKQCNNGPSMDLSDPSNAPSSVASRITGRISMVRTHGEHRSLDISLEYSAQLLNGHLIHEVCIYNMKVME